MIYKEPVERIADPVMSICAAETEVELRRVVQRSIERFGFQSYNLSFRKKDRREFMSEPTLTNWSGADLARYADEGWVEKDPLLEMAVGRAGRPMVWTPAQWASSVHSTYGEYIASTGIISGATAALDERPGSLSAITALSFADASRSRSDAYAIQIIGQVAVTRAAVLGIPRADVIGAPYLNRLSSRQMEILGWIAQGKSNADIAIIVGSSKRTVDYHVSEILRKLEVASKAQAAAIYSSQ